MIYRFSRHLAASFAILAATATLLSAGSPPIANDQLRKAASLLRNGQNQEALQAVLAAPADGQRNLLAGEAALRLKRYDEAVRYLSDAERGYPLLADIATALKADALFGEKRYQEAAAAAANAARLTPTPSISRRMEKLAADALFAAGDIKGALIAYRQFSSRHTLGKDAVDTLYQTALCLELLGDNSSAVRLYRTIYLQNPSAPQADKSLDHLKALEKKGVQDATVFTPEEMFRRGQLLLANNQPGAAAWTFSAIPRTNLPEELLARIDLRSGQAAIRQRHYSLAESFLKRAITSRVSSVRDDARLMLARLEERQGASDKALTRLLVLAAENGSLADDALLEAALLHKSSGRFDDAAQILQRLIKEFPASPLLSRAGWELAWGRYQSGNMAFAEENLRRLLKDSSYRERALYWYARTQERQNRPVDAERSYKQLLDDFPYGFYAAWYRSRSHKSTGWIGLPAGLIEPQLPEGSQRIQALVALGMMEKARTELAAFRPKANEKNSAVSFARLQQLAGDSHGSIVTFHQNRPASLDLNTVSFWAIGYPRPYAELFSKYSAINGLSDALVLSLAKSESDFRAAVKSPAGAIGLMQLMPATARMTAAGKGKKAFNPQLLTDPEYNIRLGTKHLRGLLDQYHQDTVYSLAAYNAGSGAVNRWRKAFGDLPRDEFIENIPYSETRDYVKKIVAAMTIYRSLYHIQ